MVESLGLVLNAVQGIICSYFTLNYLTVKERKYKIPLIFGLGLILFMLITFFNYLYIYEDFSSILYSIAIYASARFVCEEKKLEIIIYSLVLNILMSIGNCFAIIILQVILNVDMAGILNNPWIVLFAGALSIIILSLFSILIIGIKKQFKSLLTNYSSMFLIIFVLFYIVITILESLIFNQIYDETRIIMCLCLFCVIFILLFYIQVQYKKESVNQINFVILNHQIQNLKDHLYEFEDNSRKIRVIKHDLKKTLYVIKNFLSNQAITKADNYISSLISDIETDTTVIITGNSAIDCVLSAKALDCNKNNITFKYNIDSSVVNCIDEYDLSLLLMNSLDNAIQNISNENRRIELEIKKLNGSMIIMVKNTVDYHVLEVNPQLLSSKKDSENHGYGIISMKMLVNKYNGNIVFQQDENLFICLMILPVCEDNDKLS